jgi:NADH:ubiquinone oxidoreductase subunit E
MGGSDLLLLEDNIPEELKDVVSIEGSTCLNYCEDRTKGKAPFVEINGTLMEQATIPKILKYLGTLQKG